MEIKVGEKVVLEFVGQAYERHRREEIVEDMIILKVGRKFFYVGREGVTDEKSMIKFFLSDMRHDNGGYSPKWAIRETVQEIYDRKEHASLYEKCKSAFHSGIWNDSKKFTLDQLRRIVAIISEEGE